MTSAEKDILINTFKEKAESYFELYLKYGNSAEKMMASWDWVFAKHEVTNNAEFFDACSKEIYSLKRIASTAAKLKKQLHEHMEIGNSITMKMMKLLNDNEMQTPKDTILKLEVLGSWCNSRIDKYKPRRVGRKNNVHGKMLILGFEELHCKIFNKFGSLYVQGYYVQIVKDYLIRIGYPIDAEGAKKYIDKIRKEGKHNLEYYLNTNSQTMLISVYILFLISEKGSESLPEIEKEFPELMAKISPSH